MRAQYGRKEVREVRTWQERGDGADQETRAWSGGNGAMRKVGLVRTYQGRWTRHLSEARESLESVRVE